MKIGIRTPSMKKMFKARTTGRAKRAIKKQLTLYMEKKEWDYYILKKQYITRFIKRLQLDLEIYSKCLNKSYALFC